MSFNLPVIKIFTLKRGFSLENNVSEGQMLYMEYNSNYSDTAAENEILVQLPTHSSYAVLSITSASWNNV